MKAAGFYLVRGVLKIATSYALRAIVKMDRMEVAK
jgi:hypothetical protein